jgi:hypothetical protein
LPGSPRAFDIKVFEPGTTRAKTAALFIPLFVHDLRGDDPIDSPAYHLDRPFEILMDNACDGGPWTLACRARLVLPPAAGLR